MSTIHKKGEIVFWKWGKGIAKGKIEDIFYESVSKKIKTKSIKKNGSKENPAYYISQTEGNHVLKLSSELTQAKHSSDESSVLGDNEHFVPPAAVAKAAEKGLELHNNFGRGGTKVGVERAEGLKARKAVNLTNLKKIYSYFARHEVDKKSKDFGNEANPSNGYIAWLLWGGDVGKKWVDKLMQEIKH